MLLRTSTTQFVFQQLTLFTSICLQLTLTTSLRDTPAAPSSFTHAASALQPSASTCLPPSYEFLVLQHNHTPRSYHKPAICVITRGLVSIDCTMLLDLLSSFWRSLREGGFAELWRFLKVNLQLETSFIQLWSGVLFCWGKLRRYTT